MAENERLKERVQVLGHENYELTRMLKNEQIRNRDEDASQRRCLRQAAAKARLETRAARRLQVMEAAAVQQAQLQIKQLEEVLYNKSKSNLSFLIFKLNFLLLDNRRSTKKINRSPNWKLKNITWANAFSN